MRNIHFNHSTAPYRRVNRSSPAIHLFNFFAARRWRACRLRPENGHQDRSGLPDRIQFQWEETVTSGLGVINDRSRSSRAASFSPVQGRKFVPARESSLAPSNASLRFRKERHGAFAFGDGRILFAQARQVPSRASCDADWASIRSLSCIAFSRIERAR